MVVPAEVLHALDAGGQLRDDAIKCLGCQRYFLTIDAFDQHTDEEHDTEEEEEDYEDPVIPHTVTPCPRSRKTLVAAREMLQAGDGDGGVTRVRNIRVHKPL